MTDTVDDARARSAPVRAESTDGERVSRPRSVAVLGATAREASPTARPLRRLADRGCAGEVLRVNPTYRELAGRRCYPTLGEVPAPVDLVLAPAEQGPGRCSPATAASRRATWPRPSR